MTFDLDYSWFNFLEDYLSSATLKVYSLDAFQEADFDVLTDDDSLSLSSDTSCKSSCWMEIDVTDGLLWSIEAQPEVTEFTVRISSDETLGAFASSSRNDYAPLLVVDFDRHENIAEIQLQLMKLRAGKKQLMKGKKKPGERPGTKLNNAGAKRPGKKKPGKRPGKVNNAGSNRPGKKKPGKRPGMKPISSQNKPGKKKPGTSQNKPGKKKPGIVNKPNKKPSNGSSPKPKPDNSSTETTPDNGKHGPTPQSMGKIISNTAAAKAVLKLISTKSSSIDNKLFLYESPADGWIPSTIYKSDGLRKGLEVMNGKGVNGLFFYLGGNGGGDEYKYGLVNVASFLAQSMKETIKYDACDEVSDHVSYALENMFFCLTMNLSALYRIELLGSC